jgi:hypothetical protein
LIRLAILTLVMGGILVARLMVRVVLPVPLTAVKVLLILVLALGILPTHALVLAVV